MSDAIIPGQTPTTFEQLRRTNAHGAEYWSERDLQDHLGYKQWRRFEDAINRAITSCQQSGNEPDHHFAGVGKMVPLGSGSFREVRTSIERIGGTMPENLPPDVHIKEVRKRLKNASPKLELDERDAKGLVGE